MLVVHAPHSARLYVRGRRVHHGLTGVVMLVVGAVLLAHDRRDWPFALDDGSLHCLRGRR